MGDTNEAMPTSRREELGQERDVFAERYARRREHLSPAFKRVAAFIDANRIDVITLSALEIGRAIGTSDATVVRAVQALGFGGLHDLRSELAAGYGSRNAPAANLARTWEDVGKSADAALDDVLSTLSAGLEALRVDAMRRNMLDAIRVLHVAHRIVIFGVGPTAHVAAYFAARLRRKGRKQAVLDRTGAELADQLLDLERGDAVLMLSYGATYREAEATAAEAYRLRLPVVLITDAPNERLARLAAAVLAVPRGRSGHVALHSTTLACLEMLLLGLATTDSETAIETLGELDRLRGMTQPRSRERRAGIELKEEE